jgi:hypothetical protein
MIERAPLFNAKIIRMWWWENQEKFKWKNSYTPQTIVSLMQACRPWGCRILADQLTLYQPGGADYAHHITTGNPEFSDLPKALHIM